MEAEALSILRTFFGVVHVLAGAAWFGAMFYSFFVLHPRAQIYFERPVDFETFIATVSQGARWKVLAALGIIAATGFGLIWICWPKPLTPGWLALMAAKVGLLLGAVGLFYYVSWRLWPARILATPDEIPRFQKTFRRIAATMLLIAGLSMALGVWAR